MKTHLQTCVCHLLFCSILIGSVAASETLRAQSTNLQEYFVDPAKGNDDSGGDSVDQPLATLQKAIKLAQPGDQIWLRSGIYRQSTTIRCAGTDENPVRISAYKNEHPVLSGCDPVLGWKHLGDDVWEADCDWDAGAGDSKFNLSNTLFFDAQVWFEARQGAEQDPLHLENWGRIDRGNLTRTGFVAADLKGWPADHWVGAKVRFHRNDWTIDNNVVKSYDSTAGRIEFEEQIGVVSQKHQLGYYLFGTPKTLDHPQEWFHDVQQKKLKIKVAAGVDPNEHQIEFRKRRVALNLVGAKHVHLSGLTFRGAGLQTDDNTNHCVIKKCKFYAHDFGDYSGLLLNGNFNTLRDSEISHTWNSAVRISGSRNAMINCYLHDIGYRGITRVISMEGREHLVSHNTVEKFARSFLDGYPTHSEFAYNLFENGARLSWDTGVFDGDAGMGNGGNCVVHHNVFRNTDSIGIYCAFYAGNEIVLHHNLIYDMSPSTSRRKTPQFQKVYHNTFVGKAPEGVVDSGSVAIRSQYKNNLQIDASRLESFGITHAGNVNYRPEDFVDFEKRDLRLAASSAAIDAGTPIEAFGKDWQGKSPDAGALEFGQKMWKVGHDFDDPPMPVFAWKAFPATNLFDDTTIRQGVLSWDTSGDPQLTYGNAWNLAAAGKSFYSNTSIRLRNGDRLSRRFDNLQPNSWYRVGANIRLIDSCGNLADATRRAAPFHTGTHRHERYVTDIHDSQWIALNNLNFGAGKKYSHMEVIYTRPPGEPGEKLSTVEVYLDNQDGEFLGQLKFDNVIQDSWSAARMPLPAIGGNRDLFFVARGEESQKLRLGEVRLLQQALPSHERATLTVTGKQTQVHSRVGASDWFLQPESMLVKTGFNETSLQVSIANPSQHDAYLDRFVFYTDDQKAKLMETDSALGKFQPAETAAGEPWLFQADRLTPLNMLDLGFDTGLVETSFPVEVSVWPVRPANSNVDPVWQQTYRIGKSKSNSERIQILATDIDNLRGKKLSQVRGRFVTVSIPDPKQIDHVEMTQASIHSADELDLVSSDATIRKRKCDWSLSFPQQFNVGEIKVVASCDQPGAESPDQSSSRRSRSDQPSFSELLANTNLVIEIWGSQPTNEKSERKEALLWSRTTSTNWLKARKGSGTYRVFGDCQEADIRLASCLASRIEIRLEAKSEEHGLPSITLEDVTVIPDYRVRTRCNVARLGQASQSSDHYFNRVFNEEQVGDFFLFRGNASMGNDGIAFPLGNFTSTRLQAEPWWQVDLMSPQSIDQLVIFNRQDSGSRIGNFEVSVWDRHPDYGGEKLWAKNYDYREGDLPAGGRLMLSGSDIEPKSNLALKDIENARIVRVQTRETTLLAVSEVQVWSDGIESRTDWESDSFDYDFQQADGLRKKGWKQITPDVFGDINWDVAVETFDSGQGSVNEINRDGVFAFEPATLTHELPNGKWNVTLNLGHPAKQQSGVRVWAQGEAVEASLYSDAGEFPYAIFPVNISDGQLSLRFDTDSPGQPWHVTRMSLKKIKQ